MVPIIAEAPRVLESCLHIERVPGVCQVKTNSFRICGDNIDKTIRRRFLRSDRSNTSLHYFHSYAVLNRIDFSNLSDSLPDNSTITNMENVAVSLQPTKLDDQILQDNIGMLISRILCTRMSFFRVCFQDLVHWHIKHKYTPEMSQKSVVVPLGILLKNENKGDEMVEILTHLHQYVPCVPFVTKTTLDTGEVVEEEKANIRRVIIGGDQLTAARIRAG